MVVATGELDSLLNRSPAKLGRKRQISEEASQKLAERLSQQQGFESYEENRLWLEHECGLEASYSVVYQTARYLLESNPNSPNARVCSKTQFRKKSFKKLTPLFLMVQQLLPYFPKYSSIAHCRKRYWVENESLLG